MVTRCGIGFAATLLAAALLGHGCLGDWGYDRPFPCRAPEDCVDGYVCDEMRFVCTPEPGTESSTATKELRVIGG